MRDVPAAEGRALTGMLEVAATIFAAATLWVANYDICPK